MNYFRLAIAPLFTVALVLCLSDYLNAAFVDSSTFTWKYEFEGATADTPDNLDIDGNSYPDMMAHLSPDGTVVDGIMTISQGAYIDDYGWKPELTDGIWKANSFSAANGFTIEARIKVISSTGFYGATMIGAGPEPQAGAPESWLNIGGSEMTWSVGAPKQVLSIANNTDDFHVFRLALNPATNCYDVWRDDVQVGSDLPDIFSPSYDGLDRLYLGNVSPASLAGTTAWDYVRFTEGYYPGSAPEPVPQLNSSAFTWKYEFEGDTANTPDNLDIDGNSSPDMMGLGDPDGVVADGVMTLSQGAYIDDFGWKPELTDGIWKANSFSAANGFTIEARIKVVSSNETFGAIMIGAGPESQTGAPDSWLNIGSNEMTWNIDLPKNTLSSDDNTDDFHVFRLALNPATNCYDVWRDGVKVGSNLPDVYSPSYNGLDRLYLGDVSPSLDGTTIWDYVRFTEGYFEPESTEPPVPGDANGDGKVDGSDVTILAGNWQVGVDGTVEATWAMGDFNGDKKVDGSDVTILAGNWQYGVTASTTAVPEPGTIILLVSAIAGLLIWRRVR